MFLATMPKEKQKIVSDNSLKLNELFLSMTSDSTCAEHQNLPLVPNSPLNVKDLSRLNLSKTLSLNLD